MVVNSGGLSPESAATDIPASFLGNTGFPVAARAIPTGLRDLRPRLFKKQLQSLALDLIEAEERERRRIARLLHGDLQQILASAKFQAEILTESADEKTAKTAVSPYESLVASVSE